MGRSSKWGTKSFRKGNADDDKIKIEILEKLKDLGESGHEDKNNVAKPDTIHAMNSNWQQFSAPAFGKAVRGCRHILSKILYLFYIYFIFTLSLSNHNNSHISFVFVQHHQKREEMLMHLTMKTASLHPLLGTVQPPVPFPLLK